MLFFFNDLDLIWSSLTCVKVTGCKSVIEKWGACKSFATVMITSGSLTSALTSGLQWLFGFKKWLKQTFSLWPLCEGLNLLPQLLDVYGKKKARSLPAESYPTNVWWLWHMGQSTWTGRLSLQEEMLINVSHQASWTDGSHSGNCLLPCCSADKASLSGFDRENVQFHKLCWAREKIIILQISLQGAHSCLKENLIFIGWEREVRLPKGKASGFSDLLKLPQVRSYSWLKVGPTGPDPWLWLGGRQCESRVCRKPSALWAPQGLFTRAEAVVAAHMSPPSAHWPRSPQVSVPPMSHEPMRAVGSPTGTLCRRRAPA